MTTWIRILCILGLPLVVATAGGRLMTLASGRTQYPRATAEPPLNQRFGGYDAAAVENEWRGLDQSDQGAALMAERRMLELDLIFPFAYGGAIAAALLLGWAGLGRPFPPVLIVGPVALLMVADWTENLIQLSLFEGFTQHQAEVLDPRWVAVASVATQVKLSLLIVAVPSLAIMAAWQVLSRRS